MLVMQLMTIFAVLGPAVLVGADWGVFSLFVVFIILTVHLMFEVLVVLSWFWGYECVIVLPV